MANELKTLREKQAKQEGQFEQFDKRFTSFEDEKRDLRQDIKDLTKQVTDNHKDLLNRVERGFQENRTSHRWIIGIGLTGFGVISGVFFQFLMK